MKSLLSACIVAVTSLALAQNGAPSPDAFVSATRERIERLDRRLIEIGDDTQRQMDALACRPNCPPGTVERLGRDMHIAMDVVLTQIHAEVDGFVLHTADTRLPDLNKTNIASGLEQILPKTGLWRAVFVVNAGNRRSLIVFYSLLRGHVQTPNGTSVAIRAYNETPEDIRFSGVATSLKLVDTAGEDMNGYASPSITQLRPGQPGRISLLLWGDAIGANGLNMRMRLYKFDGNKFKTIWKPENVWGNFDVEAVDNNCFTVTGDYYREDRKRDDRYCVDDEYVALAGH